MALPDDYWNAYEGTVGSLTGYVEAVRTISAYRARTGAKFVWRGVTNADWGLHSRLFLRYLNNNNGNVPNERQLRALENAVIEEARDWGLEWHALGGRLSALELLASLQHFGVPTRLIDFTFNPLIALWFAVQAGDEGDGRIFAIDISDRKIGRDVSARPEVWWSANPPAVHSDWTTRSWIWQPPPLEPRMTRQEGCFLMGGVPTTTPERRARDGDDLKVLDTREIRACMSVPFTLVSYEQALAAYHEQRLPGRQPQARAFTLRIRNKAVLREEIELGFGYSHRSMFPDLTGLETFGGSWR